MNRLLALLCLPIAVSACGGSSVSVANKEMCIVEVAQRLSDCASDGECERGVARFAGYCYNDAPGDQMDICRGGRYFFEQPLKELAEKHDIVAGLSKKHREVIIRSGEVYCNYNFN
ncbi:MAG: hypothetical protein AAFZ58_03120 [Pseudomonadota bacterium]